MFRYLIMLTINWDFINYLNLNLILNRIMEYSLTEELNSMMQSVSRNIGKYDLTPEPLYTGLSSQVFHIVNQQDRKPQALKATAKHNHKRKPEDIKAAYIRQRKIHESLKNRYIVQLQNAFSDDSTFYLVLEYCSKGNLRYVMKNSLSFDMIRKFGEQIARGISYLHKGKIAHCHLKPQNILLTEQNQIKICDFGQAVKLQQNNGGYFRGDLNYAPPEAIGIINEQRDVWAFGCILYQMVTGKPPFLLKSWKELEVILSPNFLKHFSYSSLLPPALLHLLKHIFIHDPTKRLKIQDILVHPFFTNQQLDPAFFLTEKSQQIHIMKKPKTQRSKNNFKSLELKDANKQNKNIINKQVNNQPNYRKILDKKFREQNSKNNSKHQDKIAGSKQNSGKKATLKIYQELSNKTSKAQLAYNVRKNTFETRKGIVSPLKTDGMIIKQIDKKKSKIMIDKEGFTRCGENDWMNISCDGKIIKFRKNGTEKTFSLQNLPEKYYEKYQQAKRIIKQAMTCTPKISYKDQQFQLTIMFSNQIHVKFSDGSQVKRLQLEKLLKDNNNLQEQRLKMIQNVVLVLLSMKRK